MKKVLIIAVVIVILITGYLIYKSSYGSKTTSPTSLGPNKVVISNFSFQPETLKVKANSEVTFTNNDSTTHTITSSLFDSGNVKPGETYKQTFKTTGTFDYHCLIHPSMTGKIIVE